MLRGMASWQIEEWRIIFSREPFREHWQDVRHGILTSTVAATVGAKTKPRDYFPDFEDPEERAQERIREAVQAATHWAKCHGAKVVEDGAS